MHTLLLLVGGYLLLADKKPSSGTSAPPMVSAPPAPAVNQGAANLAAAFGAFVGAAIAQATKD
jgi:hypothetical protein